jgi:hypothetical protein
MSEGTVRSWWPRTTIDCDADVERRRKVTLPQPAAFTD